MYEGKSKGSQKFRVMQRTVTLLFNLGTFVQKASNLRRRLQHRSECGYWLSGSWTPWQAGCRLATVEQQSYANTWLANIGCVFRHRNQKTAVFQVKPGGQWSTVREEAGNLYNKGWSKELEPGGQKKATKKTTGPCNTEEKTKAAVKEETKAADR